MDPGPKWEIQCPSSSFLNILVFGFHGTQGPRMIFEHTFHNMCLCDHCLMWKHMSCFIFWGDFIYLFLEKGEGKERNINVWLPLVHSPLGTWPCDPGMYPDWESNQQPFGLQASAQSTEPCQPGQVLFYLGDTYTWKFAMGWCLSGVRLWRRHPIHNKGQSACLRSGSPPRRARAGEASFFQERVKWVNAQRRVAER